MRYWRLEFSPSGNPGTTTSLPSSFNTLLTKNGSTYSIDNKGNPNALKVVFNLQFGSDTPGDVGSMQIEIYGVTQGIVNNARELNGWNITIYGGWQNGMPFANQMVSKSSQPLFSGIVYAPWGSSIRPEIKLVLPIIITGNISNSSTPNAQDQYQGGNLQFYGKKGQSWSTVLTNNLTPQVLPNTKIAVDISDNLALTEDTLACFHTLKDYSSFLLQQSKYLLQPANSNYGGVRMLFRDGRNILITDKAVPIGTNQVQLNKYELVGNPVFSDVSTLQVISVMRSDIRLGDQLILPQVNNGNQLVGITSQYSVGSGGNYNYTQQLQGTFTVVGLQHVGDSRSPSGTGWISAYTCAFSPITTSNAGSTLNSTSTLGTSPVSIPTGTN